MMVSHQIYYLLLLVLVMAVFRACTLNVKGMQDNAKRAEVLHYLRQQNCDILFLQETHVASKADISAWENEWKGRTFWSCGSSNGRGVAILFHPSLDFSLINVRQDTEGRILTMQIHLDNTPIQLVNVYAPNAQRKEFNSLKICGITLALGCPPLSVEISTVWLIYTLTSGVAILNF